VTLLERRDVDSMSFGFQVTSTGDQWSDDGKERILTEVRLFEVSPVTAWPAYPQTSAFVRSLAEQTGEPESELAAAFRSLSGTEPLSEAHRTLLLTTVNMRGGQFVGGRLAAARATFRDRF
jgi:hypothetical protein